MQGIPIFIIKKTDNYQSESICEHNGMTYLAISVNSGQYTHVLHIRTVHTATCNEWHP